MVVLGAHLRGLYCFRKVDGQVGDAIGATFERSKPLQLRVLLGGNKEPASAAVARDCHRLALRGLLVAAEVLGKLSGGDLNHGNLGFRIKGIIRNLCNLAMDQPAERRAPQLNPFHKFEPYLLVSSGFAQGVRWLRTSRNC